MKKLPACHRSVAAFFVCTLAVVWSSCAPQATANKDVDAWEQQAQNVTIIRDDWGIAHVHGKTDADAVFGMIYAQAEDDFNRVETNYINSHGAPGGSRRRGARSTATCA